MTEPKGTAEAILDAAERLLAGATSLDEVSVRRIAGVAGAGLSAINYHFGGRDRLILAVMRRVYRRFNTERLNQLHRAVEARAPRPPDLAAVIAALIEPSVRWSNDPNSAYGVFSHFAVLAQSTHDPEIRGGAAAFPIEHLQAFVAAFRTIAPWLSDGEIGWRIHCALGIRHIAIRDRARGLILYDNDFDPAKPDELLQHIIDVVAPMFSRQAPAVKEPTWPVQVAKAAEPRPL